MGNQFEINEHARIKIIRVSVFDSLLIQLQRKIASLDSIPSIQAQIIPSSNPTLLFLFFVFCFCFTKRWRQRGHDYKSMELHNRVPARMHCLLKYIMICDFEDAGLLHVIYFATWNTPESFHLLLCLSRL